MCREADMDKESTWNGSLIEFKDGKVLLNEEGLNKVLLRDEVRDTPVAVICIAGAYNRGKSTLMNFLLQRLRDVCILGRYYIYTYSI
jgi:polynucleotide 5'-kinase involved in rRNA processing